MLLICEDRTVGVSAQPATAAGPVRRLGVRLRAGLAGLLVAALLLFALAPAPAQALEPQRWQLPDQDGRPWSLTLLEQADPAYPGGLRLRLTDRSGGPQLDHGRPLLVHDGVGGSWELANRSGELVPAGEASRPAGTAQFDLADLQPPPRAELPLALEVPLASGEAVQLVAGAAVVAALHGQGGATTKPRDPIHMW
jgi:hypothetical protein